MGVSRPGNPSPAPTQSERAAASRCVAVVRTGSWATGEARAIRETIGDWCTPHLFSGPSLSAILAAARQVIPDQVIVCGEDDVATAVLAAFRHTDLPVGIVPARPDSVLAQRLHLPASRREQLRVALDGAPRPLDLIAVRTDQHARLFAPFELEFGYEGLLAPSVDAWLRLDDGTTLERRLRSVLLSPVAGSGRLRLCLGAPSSLRHGLARLAALLRRRSAPAASSERHRCSRLRIEFTSPLATDFGPLRWLEAQVLPEACLAMTPAAP